MNKIEKYMRSAQMDMYSLASALGVDVLEVALAIKGIGLTHLDMLFAMSDLFECEIADLYPAISDHFSLLNDDEDIYEEEFIKQSANHPEILIKAGIDPDCERWYAVVKLKSGQERRYRLSSAEMMGLSENLANADNKGEMLTFFGDCRNVIVKKSAIYEVRFKNYASYAYFSSTESALQVTAVSSGTTSPHVMDVQPDGYSEDDAPWSKVVETAIQTGFIPQFIKLVDDEGETRFMSLSDMELLEIPISLIMPTLYEENSLDHTSYTDLEDMTPVGEA